MGAEFTVGTLEEMCDNVVPEKLCDTCRYRNNVEQLKPCIIYRDDCEYYEKERGDMTKEEALLFAKAINAFDKDSCGDVISREKLIGLLQEKIKTKKSTIVIADKLIPLIKSLPAVIPQEPKTGHWKRNETIRLTYCSECGFGQHIDEFRTYNYCPNCGCRMVEPQESEDKE